MAGVMTIACSSALSSTTRSKLAVKPMAAMVAGMGVMPPPTMVTFPPDIRG